MNYGLVSAALESVRDPRKGVHVLRITGAAETVFTTVHKLIAVAWLLGVGWMLWLAATAMGSTAHAMLGAWQRVGAIQSWITLAAAVTLVFGFAYGVWTRWGFGFAHDHWIIAKWILALAAGLTGPTVVAGGAHVIVALGGGATPPAGVTYHGSAVLMVTVLAAQLVTLVGAMVVSVAKPWKGKESVPA